MAEKGGWGEDEGAMSLASGVSESRRLGVEISICQHLPQRALGKRIGATKISCHPSLVVLVTIRWQHKYPVASLASDTHQNGNMYEEVPACAQSKTYHFSNKPTYPLATHRGTDDSFANKSPTS